NVDVDDLAHPSRAETDEDQRTEHRDLSNGLAGQLMDVVLVDDVEVSEKHEGQRDEDVRGKPALRREHLDLTANLLPLAKRIRNRREQLREVTADLSLDVDCQYDPLEVFATHALRHAVQRLFDGTAESSFRKHSCKLGRGRL